MKYNILFGGKAGQGPNILTQLTGEALVKNGYYVFYSRDYQSLIRGGHNFNVLTFSDEEVYSNESKTDILICLDDNTEKLHSKELKENGIILKGNYDNIYFAGSLFKILGLKFEELENGLKNIKNLEENLKHGKEGYLQEKRSLKIAKAKNAKNKFLNGSQGICEGAIKSGLDIYYAYPMTPATPILFELAPKQLEKNFMTVELENETAVINAAIGSSAVGAKTMIGTSGGGFDLMTEALSFSAIGEIPLVIYLAQRPGPGTGVATYTGQGDLRDALYSGHGEFSRIVSAPGDPIEAEELTSEAFYFSQKFKTQCIILSDKHLAESFYTIDKEAKITKSNKSTELKRYNSYEVGENGIATENAEIIKKNVENRIEKTKEIVKEISKLEMYKFYGKGENLIISWGSTKGAILDAVKELDCSFLQIKYIEPFPKLDLKKYKKVIVVENNSSSPLSDLIKEKLGIEIKEKILRYDGRPFLSDELRKEIQKLIKYEVVEERER